MVYVVSVDGGDPKGWHGILELIWHGVFTKSNHHPITMGNLLKGAIQVFDLPELQTANSPQTDCSLYMNRFLLGSMSSGITEEGKIIHSAFWFKTFTTQKLPWENSRDIDPVWMDNTIYFLSDRDFGMNIWAYDITKKQFTKNFFKEFDCKNLEGDNTYFRKRRLPLYISSWFK
jgi:hypothetical protein